MTGVQTQLLEPRIYQSIQPMQTKLVQPTQHGWFGPNVPGSLAPLEPNSTLVLLMLLFSLAGTGAYYRVVGRGGVAIGQADVSRERSHAARHENPPDEERPQPIREGTAAPENTDRSIGTPTEQSMDPTRQPAPSTASTDNIPRGMDPELLPPTERVIGHVRDNGGRVYQQELVQEMDRSASTVSRYLSELEADGRITRIRDRRRNIVMLPEAGYDWTSQPPDTHGETGEMKAG